MTTLNVIRIAGIAAGLVVLLGGQVMAQQTTPGTVANVPGFTKLSDAVIAEFKANPNSLLTSYAAGGLTLSAQVRNLVLTDPNLVDMIIDMAKKGNDVQKAAIGTGLAQAARYLVGSNPQLATQVQQKVAASGLPQLITAFVAGSNAIQTAATGAAGVGGAGLGGGNGGPTGGVGNPAGSNSGSNPGSTSFGATSGSGGFSVSGSLAGASGFLKRSVSPTGG